MTDEEWLRNAARPVQRPQIDANSPNAARVWNFLTGGRDNFDVDRRVARQLVRAAPAMEHVGYAERAFIGRVIRYLAAEAEIRQFLDIGTGIPGPGSVHDVAQSVAPESRVVCVDNDPVALSHARALLRPAPEGATGYLQADVREPGAIIARARDTLDFGRPVAVVMNHLLNHVARDAQVRSIVTTMVTAMCPGSYLVVVHPASDLDQSVVEAARRWNKAAATPVVLRDHTQITSWFDGLRIIDPGVVSVTDWRPDPADEKYDWDIPLYGVVGLKPANP